MADQIPDHIDGVGPGWHPLLLRAHSELLRVAPGYQVRQLKEKYGGLRLYLTHYVPGELFMDPVRSDAARPIVRAAEEESLTVCERCGSPGSLRDRAWLKTLCDTHA